MHIKHRGLLSVCWYASPIHAAHTIQWLVQRRHVGSSCALRARFTATVMYHTLQHLSDFTILLDSQHLQSSGTPADQNPRVLQSFCGMLTSHSLYTNIEAGTAVI